MALLFHKEESTILRCENCGNTTVEEKKVMRLSPTKYNTYKAVDKKIQYTCTNCGKVILSFPNDGHVYVKD